MISIKKNTSNDIENRTSYFKPMIKLVLIDSTHKTLKTVCPNDIPNCDLLFRMKN